MSSSGNMLSLVEVISKIKRIDDVKDRYFDTVYIKNGVDDTYYTIDDIRIDGENDIVIDIVSC